MEKTLFWDRILPLKLKHIPASNVILPPDAQRVVILVMEVGIQIQQRLAQRKVEQLCLFCCGSHCLYTLTAGLFGIGYLVDFIKILCGKFTDKDGNLIQREKK